MAAKPSLAKDIVAAGVLGLVGDIVCQAVVERRGPDEVDARRIAALTTFNAAYIGSVLHYLYQLFPPLVVRLSRPLRLPALADTSTVTHSLGCAVVDNAHNGLLYIPSYFVAVGVLEGDSLQVATASLRREWWETYVGVTLFWLPFTWFNFAIVGKASRVRFMAVGNLVWNVFVDWIAHRSHVS